MREWDFGALESGLSDPRVLGAGLRFLQLWPHSVFLRYLHVHLESRFDSSVLIQI